MSDWERKFPFVPQTQLLNLQRFAITAAHGLPSTRSCLLPLPSGIDPSEENSSQIQFDKCARLAFLSNRVYREYRAHRSISLSNRAISTSAGSDSLLTMSVDSNSFVRQLSIGRVERLWTCSAHMRFPVYCATFSICGSYLLSGGDDYLVKCWNVHTGIV